MNLEDKINNLKKKIDFDKVDISDEGYGTFIPEKKSTIERAYSTKKIADSLLKTNRKEGNKMYLESVFLYIKGYRDEEVQLQTIKVEAWHGLCKFVEGIVLQLNDTELGLRNVFEFILYNIKMHYLHLEALRCIRKKENAENVLNQYVNMKYIFDRSKIENFRLAKLDDIEEIVNHLSMVHQKSLFQSMHSLVFFVKLALQLEIITQGPVMENTILLPGEKITDDQSYIKGKYTAVHNEMVVSTTYGTPKTINKLLLMEPRYTLTYTGQIGDVIIGRVTGIFNKKWKLEANSPNEVTLHLSAINLPGVEQRRKMEEDEIKMREYFNIDDLVVSEVQKVFKNGNIAVHTRNEKFRKLQNGVLIDVPVMLIKRFRSQFLTINNVVVIVGMNGKIWIEQNEDNDAMIRIIEFLQKCKNDNCLIDFDAIKL